MEEVEESNIQLVERLNKKDKEISQLRHDLDKTEEFQQLEAQLKQTNDKLDQTFKNMRIVNHVLGDKLKKAEEAVEKGMKHINLPTRNYCFYYPLYRKKYFRV